MQNFETMVFPKYLEGGGPVGTLLATLKGVGSYGIVRLTPKSRAGAMLNNGWSLNYEHSDQ